MSKNYDNWERLVRAVLRKERDKQIALCHSPSSSSFSSSASQFDYEQPHSQKIEVPMDYSELTLDHSKWKEMLPPHKQAVVWRSASLSFFLDQTTGKNCFMLGAARLEFSCDEGFERIWEMKSDHSISRFSEVAKIVATWENDMFRGEICGRIYEQMLSPETLYAAYLVFELTERYEELQTVSSRNNFLADYYVYPIPRARADGWKELELGNFYVYQGGNRTIQVQLLDVPIYSGLTVEGIEFRPLEGKKNGSGKKYVSSLAISLINIA